MGTLLLWNEDGRQRSWKDCRILVGESGGDRVRAVTSISEPAEGGVTFTPVGWELPVKGTTATLFREFCLNLLANYPEIVGRRKEDDMPQVHHQMHDKHHLFTVSRGERSRLWHTWGSHTKPLDWDRNEQTAEEVVAKVLEVPVQSVWVTPHQWLARLKPLWRGKRRWTQTRAKYKKLLRQQNIRVAETEMKSIKDAWETGDATVAKALNNLAWTKVHRMAGTTLYQTQNIVRLKYNRLRLWAGAERRYGCLASECREVRTTGTAHLIWQCPEAQKLWGNLLRGWGRAKVHKADGGRDAKVVHEIFAFKLQQLPAWLVQWGYEEQLADWKCLYEVANDLWGLACGTTVTAIWRRNVERLHPEGRKVPLMEVVVAGHQRMVHEAYARYRMGLFPVTPRSLPRLNAAVCIARQWCSGQLEDPDKSDGETMGIGFFDGGPRGNPGPGGSGSVVIEKQGGRREVVWAAATALGRSTMTNNVAEFVGLHRLLATAEKKNWRGIHVVGDSALIINMMAQRRTPKAKTLLHWYRLARRLADRCRVQSWSHHYRQFNKMADWLANNAMDTGASSMQMEGGSGDEQKLLLGARA